MVLIPLPWSRSTFGRSSATTASSRPSQNFSANPYRRVDLTVTVNNSVDRRQAIRLLEERVARRQE
jgi:hypothetical protein